MNFYSQSFLQIIIKASVADLIFSKTLCFQHFMLLTSILMSTFRRMPLKDENYSLRPIFFKVLKQRSDYKNLNAKYLIHTLLK